MDWFFENLGKIVTFVIFIVYILGSLRGAAGQQEEVDDPEAADRARRIQEEIRRKILERQGRGAPPESEQSEESEEPHEREEPAQTRSERTLEDQARESREEMERETTFYPKQQRRQSGPLQAPQAQRVPELRREPPLQVPGALEGMEVVEDLEESFAEQKRRIEAQMAEADRLRREAIMNTGSAVLAPVVRTEYVTQHVAPTQILREVRGTLGNRKSLRSAIVVKEILDKPVGLRER